MRAWRHVESGECPAPAGHARLSCHSCGSAAAVKPWQKYSCAVVLFFCCVLYVSATDLLREEVLQERDNSLKSVLPTDNGEVTVLQAGRHEFPFTFQLPE